MLSMQDDDVTVTFTRPSITPKVYLSKGPSGWPEPFKRDVADRQLLAFIKPVAVRDLVDVFIARRDAAENKTVDWYTVVGFLGRTMGCSPKMVPHIVGVAFWAHVVMLSRPATN